MKIFLELRLREDLCSGGFDPPDAFKYIIKCTMLVDGRLEVTLPLTGGGVSKKT